MAKTYEELEARVTALEKLVESLNFVHFLIDAGKKKLARKPKEYTDEERATIRARLLAGQEAARKRREAEAKTTAAKKDKPVAAKKTIANKVAKNSTPPVAEKPIEEGSN